MRLLFLNRSYHPDVEATGQLLTELCSDLARRHDVEVIAGRPNFVEAGGAALVQRDRHLGVDVTRVRNVRFTKKSLLGRALGLVSYLVLALGAALLARRPDVIVVETDPPLLGLLGAVLKRWHRCCLVFYLQDLYPEVGLALGKLRPGVVTRLLHWATQVGLRAADRVVVLGHDMREKVLARGVPAEKIDVVPNWADTDLVRPTAGPNPLRAEWGLGDSFVVMYSGNLGLSQNLDPLLAAAANLRGTPVSFVLVGEGAAKAGLQARAAAMGLDNVRFLPYQPKEQLGVSLGAADVHFIPLRRGLAGCIVPSKLYGVLAAGVPYIAAVDAESETAHVTRQFEAGLVIEPDAAPALTSTISWCLGHRPALAEMGRRGRRAAEEWFSRPACVGRFAGVISGLARKERVEEPVAVEPLEPALALRPGR
jgi:glycosyltransferase involved in cell wall biosynthesis